MKLTKFAIASFIIGLVCLIMLMDNTVLVETGGGEFLFFIGMFGIIAGGATWLKMYSASSND